MARFVIDIDSGEFDPLADKTATLVDELEHKCGYKMITVHGILDDNRCQFDEYDADRLINLYRIAHDCVLIPPSSVSQPVGAPQEIVEKSKLQVSLADMPLTFENAIPVEPVVEEAPKPTKKRRTRKKQVSRKKPARKKAATAK